jgi:hypothetical protein
MKFITSERMKRESLEWGELIEPNEHSDFWHHEIVDSTGKVFIGVVHEDGSVETAYTMWDSIDTFERFKVRPILRHYSGHVTTTVHWDRDTNLMFCERSHRSTCDTEIYRIAVSEVLDWFLGATEHDVMELAKTGHVCLIVPAQLKEQIEKVAAAEDRSFNAWVITRLSECIEDDRSRTSLAQAADRRQRFKEIIERAKERRALLVSN